MNTENNYLLNIPIELLDIVYGYSTHISTLRLSNFLKDSINFRSLFECRYPLLYKDIKDIADVIVSMSASTFYIYGTSNEWTQLYINLKHKQFGNITLEELVNNKFSNHSFNCAYIYKYYYKLYFEIYNSFSNNFVIFNSLCSIITDYYNKRESVYLGVIYTNMYNSLYNFIMDNEMIKDVVIKMSNSDHLRYSIVNKFNDLAKLIYLNQWDNQSFYLHCFIRDSLYSNNYDLFEWSLQFIDPATLKIDLQFLSVENPIARERFIHIYDEFIRSKSSL